MSLRYVKSMFSVVVVSLLPVIGFADDSVPASTQSQTMSTDSNSSTSSGTMNNSSDTTNTPSSTDSSTTTTTSEPSSSSSTTTSTSSSSTNAQETFHQVCVKSWMGRSNDIKDRVDFQNFGEKYCACAETQQPLDSNEAINMAAQVCMSRTLLQDAVDNLSDEVGLSKAKVSDVSESCMNRWQLVYPNMDDNDKKAAGGYCDCAAPKLMDVFKKSQDLTDKGFTKSIDDVAATCSGKVGK